MSKVIGYRQGVRQSWPIYNRPPVYHPLAVGGACPPTAPLTRLAGGGYSCVEGASYQGFGGSDYPDVGSCPGWFSKGSGDYCSFDQLWWATDEVYVFRFQTMGAPINTTSSALAVVMAYVRAVVGFFGRTFGKDQDIRGITLKELGPTVYQVEIVITTPGGARAPVTIAPSAVVDAMQKQLARPIVNPRFLQLTNKGAAQDWFTKPVVWSSQQAKQQADLGKDFADGGRTKSFGDQQGVYNGTAAQIQFQVQPRADVPIAPPGVLPDYKAPPPKASSSIEAAVGKLDTSTMVLLAGGAAVAYWAYTTRKKS